MPEHRKKHREKEGVWYVVIKGKRDKRRGIYTEREQEIVKEWRGKERETLKEETLIHSAMSSQRKKG